MAWRSLFAFDNPNGEVGRQFNGTLNPNIIQTIPLGGQLVYLYSFQALPIGIYSINLSFNLSQTGEAYPVYNPSYTGVGSSSIDSALYPIDYIISVQTTSNIAFNAFTSSFLVKKTNNNPIYINALININSGGTASIVNTIGWYCIATKLA